jgi:hypothetical protein
MIDKEAVPNNKRREAFKEALPKHTFNNNTELNKEAIPKFQTKRSVGVRM